MLAGVDERRAHRQRVEAERDPPLPAAVPEEQRHHERERGVQRRHRGDRVDPLVLDRGRDRLRAGVGEHLVLDLVDEADPSVLGREPRRRRREQHVGGESGGGEPHHQRPPPLEERIGEAPQDDRKRQGPEEVGDVGDPGRVVVPGRRRRVVEVVLQVDGRDRRSEEDSIYADHLRVVRGDPGGVGDAAREVVGEQERDERQPVDEQPAEVAPPVVERQDEQEAHQPHEDDVARDEELAEDGHEHGRDADVGAAGDQQQAAGAARVLRVAGTGLGRTRFHGAGGCGRMAVGLGVH